MKVYIDTDEWYPVYTISAYPNDEIDLSEEEIDYIKKAEQMFENAQRILRKALNPNELKNGGFYEN